MPIQKNHMKTLKIAFQRNLILTSLVKKEAVLNGCPPSCFLTWSTAVNCLTPIHWVLASPLLQPSLFSPLECRVQTAGKSFRSTVAASSRYLLYKITSSHAGRSRHGLCLLLQPRLSPVQGASAAFRSPRALCSRSHLSLCTFVPDASFFLESHSFHGPNFPKYYTYIQGLSGKSPAIVNITRTVCAT